MRVISKILFFKEVTQLENSHCMVTLSMDGHRTMHEANLVKMKVEGGEL